MKVNFFCWKLYWLRLPYKKILYAKDLIPQAMIGCDLNFEQVENLNHVFIQCNFAQHCWDLLSNLCQRCKPSFLPSLFEFISNDVVGKKLTSLVTYLTWQLCQARNDRIFQDQHNITM